MSTITLLGYIQQKIFKYLFDDIGIIFKWKLSLNLVSQRWFNFMKSEISKSYSVECSPVSFYGFARLYDYEKILNPYNIMSYAHRIILNVPSFSILSMVVMLESQYIDIFKRIVLARPDSISIVYDYETNFKLLDQMVDIINDHCKHISFVKGVHMNTAEFANIIEWINVPIRELPVIEIPGGRNDDHVYSLFNSLQSQKHMDSINILHSFHSNKYDFSTLSTDCIRFSYKFYGRRIQTPPIDLFKYLQKCTQLCKLRISFETLDTNFLDFISTNTTITSLNLEHMINDYVLSAILNNVNISKLKLSQTIQNPPPQLEFLPNIRQPNTTLRYLKLFTLVNCEYNDRNQIFYNPTEFCKNLHTLKMAYLFPSHNEWLATLGQNQTIKHIYLNQGYRTKFDRLIINQLKLNQSIIKLELGEFFSDIEEIAINFAKHIEENQSIQIISVCHNESIVKSLKQSKTFNFFNLNQEYAINSFVRN